MSFTLSEGSIMTIMNGGEFNQPILQVLSLKRINANTGQERYRVFLSDGQHTISFAMMTAPVYAQAGPNGLNKNAIIKVKRYITSVINNTGNKGDSRVLLLLEIELLADGELVGERIGNPKPYSDAVPSSATEARNNSFESNAPPAKVPKLVNSNGTSSSINNGSTDASTSFSSNLSKNITHPISSLSPYHNKWIIKARVTNKTPIRTWSNSRGEGKLFNIDLVDESGEIRLTAFKDLVDKYFDKIEVDKVYYISRCQVKMANKNFNALNHDYELAMVDDTIVEECDDSNGTSNGPPQMQYNFVTLDKIPELEPSTVIDIIGVVKQTGDLQTIQARSSGREFKKKEVILLDQSKTSVALTLWGVDAESFDGSNNPVVVVKGARVNEFSGSKSLTTGFASILRINPEIKEAYRLKGWYESEGSEVEVNNISTRTVGNYTTQWMTFKQALDDQLGSTNPSGDYYQLKGTVLLFKAENACYKACPEVDCNKKVIDISNGMYRCEKCNKEYENFKWRLIANMNVGDPTGNQWMSMFTSEAEKVIGMAAQEAGDLYENDNVRFREALEAAHFKQFILKCRVKMERFNDEQRLKTVVIKVDDVNHAEYNAHLIKSCKEYLSLS